MLHAVLQPFLYGVLTLDDAEGYVRRFLARWPAHWSQLSRRVLARSCDRVVLMPVVHISAGHGTGIGCACEAAKLLQAAYLPKQRELRIPLIQHLVTCDPQCVQQRSVLGSCWREPLATRPPPTVCSGQWPARASCGRRQLALRDACKRAAVARR